MNDDDATLLVDRLAAGLPDTAPPPALVAAGRAARRHRRRTPALAGLAAVVLLVAGIAVAPALLDRGSETPAPAGTLPFPDPPPGMKWVGQERVVVAVPVDWAVTDQICGAALASAVVSETDGRCVGRLPGQVSRQETVWIRPYQAADDLLVPRRCSDTSPAGCEGVATLADEGVTVSVFLTGAGAKELVDVVLDSLMVLPDGWTTVPFATNTTLGRRSEVLEQAGFEVTLQDALQDSDATGGTGVTSHPELGSPIEVGGAITIGPAADLPAPTMVARPSIGVAGQEIDLLFPTGQGRGIAFRIDEPDGAGWRPAYYLVAPYSGTGEPTWSHDNRGTVDIGIGGPGPDRVVVPPVATPGRYRICTDNAAEEACAPITVVE
ncbi:hypothetical protein BH11ACT8_BH11ACT8_18820 [soil metagenome]